MVEVGRKKNDNALMRKEKFCWWDYWQLDKLTFGTFFSRDSARNTRFKIPFSNISLFSSLNKSSDLVRHPKKSQTFGTSNDEFCDLISASSCQKLRKGAVPVPISASSFFFHKDKFCYANWIKNSNSPGPIRSIGWALFFGIWKPGAFRINICTSSSFSRPSK